MVVILEVMAAGQVSVQWKFVSSYRLSTSNHKTDEIRKKHRNPHISFLWHFQIEINIS